MATPGRRAYQDAQRAAAEDPEFAEWFREHSCVRRHRRQRRTIGGCSPAPASTATEAELRDAVTRLREALYLMTSLAAHFVKLYARGRPQPTRSTSLDELGPRAPGGRSRGDGGRLT